MILLVRGVFQIVVWDRDNERVENDGKYAGEPRKPSERYTQNGCAQLQAGRNVVTAPT